MNKNRTNKILYEVGQRVRLQNIATRDWDLKGTIDIPKDDTENVDTANYAGPVDQVGELSVH